MSCNLTFLPVVLIKRESNAFQLHQGPPIVHMIRIVYFLGCCVFHVLSLDNVSSFSN